MQYFYSYSLLAGTCSYFLLAGTAEPAAAVPYAVPAGECGHADPAGGRRVRPTGDRRHRGQGQARGGGGQDRERYAARTHQVSTQGEGTQLPHRTPIPSSPTVRRQAKTI